MAVSELQVAVRSIASQIAVTKASEGGLRDIVQSQVFRMRSKCKLAVISGVRREVITSLGDTGLVMSMPSRLNRTTGMCSLCSCLRLAQ